MAEIPYTWPPSLTSYKIDLKLKADDDRFDDALTSTLNAAIDYVIRARPDVDYAADPFLGGMDLILGTLRYARRLDIRRETAVGVMVAGDLGTAGIAQTDADIETLLRVGRRARIRFA